MDIKWIDDFLSLARTRNFSRSANERNVTQSALSRRIRSLEEWLGADLVDRSTYPLVLTPAGKLFSTSSSEVIRLLTDTRAMLRGQVAESSMLRICAGHTLSLNFFPQWLKRLASPPAMRVVPVNVHDSVLSMNEGNCDLLMCYSHPDMPLELDPTRFECMTLGTEMMTPVAAPGRSGAAAHALPGGRGNAVPLLAYTPGTYFSRVVERIGERASQERFLVPVYESDMAEVLKSMALAGHGMAWLPESCMARELAEGRLVRAGGSQWSLALDIRLFRAVDNRNPQLEAFWHSLAPIAPDYSHCA